MTKSDSTMTSVGIHEAKTHLSKLLRMVEGGEEVQIMRGKDAIARLVPIRPASEREFGFAAGTIVIADNFDEPADDFSAGETFPS